MEYKQIEEKLKEMLPERRLQHSLNVSKCAVKLSQIYDCDENKAKIAGLVHDCAKYFTDDQIEDCIKKFNIDLDPLEENNIALSHSVIGSYVVKEVFNIDDEEILNAIKYHTTGKENMTKLEKIIYIADMIEPSRDFEGVDELRKVTLENLNKGVLMGINQTINFLIKKGNLIDLNTIKARNSLID